ncbi:methyltransferase domain-containing protein [Jiangella rhizosphaerae]|uniref:Methyltransferase domain-containing protein n=1 Tax=Jiangella rhizosphaerae TaxID=2293569 RepID=A0A418KH41_9ACTN|nr:methyltransferase domain-containing protein [Jiangella rhizosphaerae]RIQ11395.1 methyltransferase domain-containing protein [Jiangella rhizosphaerae]
MATYTHGHHESVLRSHTWRTVANSAAYLRDRLTPGTDVLDVGCGPGTITTEFASLVAPGRVVGLDASADVIGRAAAGDGAGAVEFVTGDAAALPFETATFDVVHAHQLLQHVADPVAVLREMARVARPDGVVAARDSDYAGMIWYPRLPGLSEWLELYRTLALGNGGEPDAGRRLLAWAHEAGLSAVTATASVWCFSSPDDRAWWGGLWADRVTSSAFAEQAVGRGLATTADLDRLAATWREWAGHDDGWFLVPHGEILARVTGIEFVPAASPH